jgi:hypothetical protein
MAVANEHFGDNLKAGITGVRVSSNYLKPELARYFMFGIEL